jgi:hypothetical protein
VTSDCHFLVQIRLRLDAAEFDITRDGFCVEQEGQADSKQNGHDGPNQETDHAIVHIHLSPSENS